MIKSITFLRAAFLLWLKSGGLSESEIFEEGDFVMREVYHEGKIYLTGKLSIAC